MVALKRARRAAVVYVLVGVAFVVGLGFFLGAFYIWVAGKYGSIEAALIFGGGFIVLALLILLIDRLTARSRARKIAHQRKSDLTAMGIAAALAVLPAFLRSRAGAGTLLAPAIALVAYAIYRENSRPRNPDEPAEP